jgi:predicted small secreted protein
MRTKSRLALAIILLAAAAPLLTACYTTKGAGEDIQAAGHGISNTADKVTGYKP